MQHIGMQICIHIIYMHAAQYPRYPHAFSATPTEQSQDPQSAMLVALAISSPLFIIVMNTVSNIIVDNIITNMVTHIVGNDIHIYIYIYIYNNIMAASHKHKHIGNTPLLGQTSILYRGGTLFSSTCCVYFSDGPPRLHSTDRHE